MPTLQIKLAPALGPAVQAELARELTQLSSRLLGKREEVTAVMVEMLPAAQWFIGGEVIAQPTAWLEISITAGTNTEGQKAAFIHAAHTALRRHVGAGEDIAPATYVIVRELAATDWGYGGHTQAARRTLAATL
jgi:4-oxalocrotonate tautomerase